MDTDAKLRPIYIYHILKERTDENHFLTTSQLCTILQEEYDISAHRTTIKSDIDVLQQAGIGIQVVRSSQNQYNYIDRDFDVAELKLLIDAVQSAKFLTKAKSDDLIKKIVSLGGVNAAHELNRNLVVCGRNKKENEQIFIIVDSINAAINNKKKIKFQKVEYNIKKERMLHNKGEYYIFSPYSLIWDGDYYYVVGYSEKYKSIGSHRIDRIYQRPEILNEIAYPEPKGFDINRYVNILFHMYDSPRKTVELICSNEIIDAIIDRFGTGVEIFAYDQENFRIIEEVPVGKLFFNWIFGFEGKVRIKAPEDVKAQYQKQLKNAFSLVCID